jgi:DNA-directed RNA polymerase subunit omega
VPHPGGAAFVPRSARSASSKETFRMATSTNGIIDPPIDDLLSKVESKYALVIFASKRARQINDYYADLHEGSLFDNVGPLVDSSVDDKPLSVAMHEINEDRLVLKPIAAAE